MLLQDYQLIEKLAHQNRERIPERVVHAKGWGAYGTLKITGDISRYTKAKALQPGAETPLILRFSTVAGELGAADAERDVRGFALKFYTSEGNWDLVGNNTPVFFVRDPLKFPDFIHTQKRHPQHQYALADGDVGLLVAVAGEPASGDDPDVGSRPADRRAMHMNGYGSHTYSFWNDAGERFWVKFHFKTQQGHKYWTNAEAEKVIGKTREIDQEDLFGAHRARRVPELDGAGADHARDATPRQTPYNPFDLTKVWPHGDFPPIDIGVMELNRNADNYFAEIEQAAFSPSNIVPGIGFSPDKMLQARIFSYADAHRYRLGTHYEALPVNQPKVPGPSLSQGRPDELLGGSKTGNPDAYYEPNCSAVPVEDSRRRRSRR